LKPEDTIIQTNEENCHNTLEERLLEQTKVSFRAGVKVTVEFIRSYLVTTVHSGGDVHHIDDKEWQSVEQRLFGLGR